jgi:osmotically-inducible protein OsmY
MLQASTHNSHFNHKRRTQMSRQDRSRAYYDDDRRLDRQGFDAPSERYNRPYDSDDYPENRHSEGYSRSGRRMGNPGTRAGDSRGGYGSYGNYDNNPEERYYRDAQDDYRAGAFRRSQGGYEGENWGRGNSPVDYEDYYEGGRGRGAERSRYMREGADYERAARQRHYGQQRGFMERAADEVSSWFGDDDAQRRRNLDQFRGKGPKNYSRSDDRIREDVCDRLTDESSLDASNIDVAVAKCEVTLSGTVASRDQRRRAEDCAELVSGVRHVQNNLRVDDQANLTSADMSYQNSDATNRAAAGSGTTLAAATASKTAQGASRNGGQSRNAN